MDIIVKTVLDFIQSNESTENSVIAGGAVRDHVLGLEARDYDIFIPANPKNSKVDKDFINRIKKEFGVEVKHKGEEYETTVGTIQSVENFIFEGKEFDLIFKHFPNDEEFGSKVISEFDYGLNMAMYNGLYIEESDAFKYDRDNYTMTLINMQYIWDLPKLMERYNNFCKKNKIPYTFRSTCLELKRPEPKVTGKAHYDRVVDELFRPLNNGAVEGVVFRAADNNRVVVDPWDVQVEQPREEAPRPVRPALDFLDALRAQEQRIRRR